MILNQNDTDLWQFKFPPAVQTTFHDTHNLSVIQILLS